MIYDRFLTSGYISLGEIIIIFAICNCGVMPSLAVDNQMELDGGPRPRLLLFFF